MHSLKDLYDTCCCTRYSSNAACQVPCRQFVGCLAQGDLFQDGVSGEEGTHEIMGLPVCGREQEVERFVLARLEIASVIVCGSEN